MKASYFQKMPITYVISAPPPINDPYAKYWTSKYWVKNSIKIGKEPQKTVTYLNDYQVERYELTPEEIQEIGLETALASPGTVDVHINLAGEIRVNQDRMAHIVPRVEGVVTKVNKKLGDTVKAGEVIAVIESQELADALRKMHGKPARLTGKLRLIDSNGEAKYVMVNSVEESAPTQRAPERRSASGL